MHDCYAAAAGFVHVIDDETKWDGNFGRSVLAGLLGLGANVGQVRPLPTASMLLLTIVPPSALGLKTSFAASSGSAHSNLRLSYHYATSQTCRVRRHSSAHGPERLEESLEFNGVSHEALAPCRRQPRRSRRPCSGGGRRSS